MRPYAKQRFLRHHPVCCFCGGLVPSTECDHQPSLSLYPEAHGRSSQLIFPACDQCNRISSKAESSLPLILSNDTEPDRRRAFQSLVGAHSKWRPDFIKSMLPSNREKRKILRQTSRSLLPDGMLLEDWPVLTLSQSEWRPYLEVFARKMTLAMFYRHAKRPLPLSGRLWTTFSFNFDVVADRMNQGTQEMASQLEPDEEVSIDGELAIAAGFDGEVYAFMVSVRDKMLVTAFCSDDPKVFSNIAPTDLLGPFQHASTLTRRG